MCWNMPKKGVHVFTWFEYEQTPAWAKFSWTSSKFEFDQDVNTPKQRCPHKNASLGGHV